MTDEDTVKNLHFRHIAIWRKHNSIIKVILLIYSEQRNTRTNKLKFMTPACVLYLYVRGKIPHINYLYFT